MRTDPLATDPLDGAGGVDGEVLIRALADEYAGLAAACGRIESLVAALVAQAPEDLKGLALTEAQALDRVIQHAQAMAAFSHAVAAGAVGSRFAVARALTQVPLSDLERRLSHALGVAPAWDDAPAPDDFELF